MKYIKQIFAMMLLCVAASCSDDDTTGFSQTKVSDVKWEGDLQVIDIKTSGEWTATSRVNWCQVVGKTDEGVGNGQIKISVDPNLNEARTGVIKVWTPDQVFDITVNQQACTGSSEWGYTLPVIFHVFYSDESNKKEHIDGTRIAEVLENVNKLYDGQTRYSGGAATQDMNLNFVLATTDEKGDELETPGVEYIQVKNAEMEPHTFMGDKANVKYLWDPNRYINVMLYHFEDTDDGGVILGVSHMPYNAKGAPALDGLGTAEVPYLTKNNLAYTHCVSINSLFIDDEMTPQDVYVGTDINVTIAHELGHYLGLHHAFDEAENGSLSSECIDSDFCEDTPSYDRNAYWMNALAILNEAQQQGTQVKLEELTARENCKTGQTFHSYNLMDYEFSYADRFTPNQRDRIRHVLTYSPLIPGPKKNAAATRTAVEGIVDLPVMIRE